MKIKKTSFWFTLVELIVVITIIALLGTIGFISYSNYIITARDSSRIAQLSRIADALEMYAAQEPLPLPENSVNLTDGTNTIVYQWDLWTWVIRTINHSSTVRDPLDDTFFTYLVSVERNNFQLLVFMEEYRSLQSSRSIISESYANLSNRYPKVNGVGLWILTDLNNIPIQRLSLPWNTLDITSTTLTLKSFLSDSEFVVDNPTTLPQLQELIPQGGRYWSVIDNEFVRVVEWELSGWEE